MLTSATDSGPAKVFTQASEKSGFGQVFKKNMDKNSFYGDIHKAVEVILSKSQHAFFYDQDDVRNSEEYKTCQVSRTFFLQFVIRLRTQLFTSLMADICQDINSVSS